MGYRVTGSRLCFLFKNTVLHKHCRFTSECAAAAAAAAAAAKSLQSCRTLCDPIESSSPGSPVPGILQARTLESECATRDKERSTKIKHNPNINKQSLLVFFITYSCRTLFF